MEVKIMKSKKVGYVTKGRYIFATMKCGKHLMSVSILEVSTKKTVKHRLSAVMHNASHREFKQHGKIYRSFDDALRYYKSAEARAMIEAARDLWNSAEVAA